MATQNILKPLEVQNATCPEDKLHKDYKDGGNLFLRVYRDGRKNWIIRLYRGKDNFARGCGSYPAVSLKEARESRDAYKKLWERGIDPMVERKRIKHTVINQKDLTFGKAYQTYLDNKAIPNLSTKSIKRMKEFYK